MPELDEKTRKAFKTVEEHTDRMMQIHKDNQAAKRNRKTLEDHGEATQ